MEQHDGHRDRDRDRDRDGASEESNGAVTGGKSAEQTEAALEEAGGVMNHLVGTIENEQVLDEIASVLHERAERLTRGEVGSLMRGDWLGHAIHPILTDLPIGFWTSAMALDLVSPRKGRRLAKRLLGLGIISAIPTALTGLSEFALTTDDKDRRIGAAHAIGNTAALGLFTISWMKRSRGQHIKGMMYSSLGATAATMSAALGGHMVYNRGLGGGPGRVDRSGEGSIGGGSVIVNMAHTIGANVADVAKSDGSSTEEGSTEEGSTAGGSPVAMDSSVRDELIDLTSAAERLGQPPEQVMALSASGILPNHDSSGSSPCFTVHDVEAVRLMGG